MRFPLHRFSSVLFVFLSAARFLTQCLLPHTHWDFRELPWQTLAQAKGEFGELYHSPLGLTCALRCCASAHPTACPLCHKVCRGRGAFAAEAWRAVSLLLWTTKARWLLSEWIAKAKGSNFTWLCSFQIALPLSSLPRTARWSKAPQPPCAARPRTTPESQSGWWCHFLFLWFIPV